MAKFEMVIEYGALPKNSKRSPRPENIQKLGFKVDDDKMSTATKRALKLCGLLKRAGTYKSVKLLSVSRDDAFVKYAQMPTHFEYTRKSERPQFVKDAIKAALKAQKNPQIKSSLKSGKPVKVR